MTEKLNIDARLSLRRIVYFSRATASFDAADLDQILVRSRHNNALNGVSGILWSDGKNFVQVFEGPLESTELTWNRIRSDPRHCEINIVQDIRVALRQFGYWTMLFRQSGDQADHHEWHVCRLLSKAPTAVSGPFLTMLRKNASDHLQ